MKDFGSKRSGGNVWDILRACDGFADFTMEEVLMDTYAMAESLPAFRSGFGFN